VHRRRPGHLDAAGARLSNPPPPYLAIVESGTLVESRHGEVVVPWWSFTKTVLAATALTLVRDGKLDLDTLLPQRFHTLRQLLQHRAGVANYGGLKAYHEAVARGDDAWPESVLLEQTQADRLIAEPGSRFAYSNIGYLFVRHLIEQATNQPLASAIATLVLKPLGVTGARLAEQRSDIAGVVGIVDGYDPHWVYHGLLVGPLSQATLLLDGLATSDLLPTSLRQAMFDCLPLPWPEDERPWKAPGYGLGVMGGIAKDGRRMAGHTGGGPGSVVAIYRPVEGEPSRTAAVFALGSDQGYVERASFSGWLPDLPRP